MQKKEFQERMTKLRQYKQTLCNEQEDNIEEDKVEKVNCVIRQGLRTSKLRPCPEQSQSADNELSTKLLQWRADHNQGIDQPQSPSRRIFNPYTEFKEFSRKQIKDMEKMFKQYDASRDGFIDLMELKLLMEKLGAPHTHLGLKSMINEVDEDFDSKLSFREFLLIFHKAATGELQEDGGLNKAFKGAKNFFEAKVQVINVSSSFEEEIKAEQEERKKQAEEVKQRKAAFKELQSTFK
ncbi:EF-hand domain-containing protein D2 [Sigmodon hispidus]